MSVVLAVLGWGAFGLAIVAGLILDVAGLFGNWIILGAVAAAWVATDFAHFGAVALGVMTGLAILGEVIEMLAAGVGAAKFGGSKRTIVAACVGCLIGAVVGTPWFPIVGTLIGACLGAFLGAMGNEYLNEQRTSRQAAWAGLGAALGKVAGLFAKALIGLAMLAVAALSY